MNCRNIARLLIGQGISRLADKQLSEFKLHLASCHDCTGDWEIHAHLIALPVPEMPAGLAARCRAAVAARPGGGKRRKSSRYILFGTALVVAAAAAMLALHLVKPDRPPMEPADPVIMKPQSVGGNEVNPPDVNDAAVDEEGRLESADETQVTAPPGFTVQVMPLIQDAKDTDRQAEVRKHYTALLAELRAVPGLRLITSDEPGRSTNAKPDFRITVRTQEPEDPLRPPLTPDDLWSVDLRLDSRREDGSMVFLAGRGYGGILEISCMRKFPGTKYCDDATRIAAERIEELRLKYFPPDPSLTRKLEAQLGNTVLPILDRYEALVKLLKRDRKPADWNPAVIRDAVELAASAQTSLPGNEVWLQLRGVRHPDLIPPLLERLGQETNDVRRLELVTILVEDFGTEPSVHSLLESLARSDRQPSVKNMAASALHGDEAWRKYVLDTLQDASLSAAERIKPLTHNWGTSQSFSDLVAMVGNDAVLAQIAQLLPQIWNRPRQEETDGTNDLWRGTLPDILADIDHPTVVEIMLDALRNSQNHPDRIKAAGWLQRHLGNPRVQKALEDAAAKDPDSEVRLAARRSLKPREPEPEVDQGVK